MQTIFSLLFCCRKQHFQTIFDTYLGIQTTTDMSKGGGTSTKDVRTLGEVGFSNNADKSGRGRGFS